MKQYLKAFYKAVIAIALLVVVWGGAGAFLRNQQETMMFWLGTALNLGIIVPVAYLIQSSVRDVKKAINDETVEESKEK